MPHSSGREKTIFLQAAEIAAEADRAAYLDLACGNDRELRAMVEALLVAHHSRQPLLDMTVADSPSPLGTQIGPYKLLQVIGEGGMGVVYMAEQRQPVERRVALKIIKPGMDSHQVIARFEAERQALALMDHPNIAKVLDAGTTAPADGGYPDRPYFVMELVKGQPITQYCDDTHLTPRQRLELLLPVCQAIQHAHQKGIIHRDIKPTNVLVALYDGVPVPKVIDFGVAKATGPKLTDKTMFTGFGQLVGTLEYMSPEQAQLNQLDVDTRSDIYSLGVLLYELLTGTTPFDRKRLQTAAFDEMLRIIREEEPPKPSTKLSSSATLSAIAASRGMEPSGLPKAVRGELDWIVMKTLEKDRSRRYETASNFAADLQRYLNDEPVHACRPSATYRCRKFARRHKAGLAVAGLVLFFIVLFGGGVGWAMRDRTAREEQLAQERTARQAKISGQLEMILKDVARLEQAEKWADALVSARRAEPALATGEAPPDIQERARQTLVDLELVRQLDEIRAQSGTVWGSGPQEISAAGLGSRVAEADQKYTAALRQAGIDIDALPVKEAVDRLTARRAIAAALVPALDDWVAVRSLGKDEGAARRLIDVLHGADPDPWRQRVRDALARKDWPALRNLATSTELDRQSAATLCFLYAALKANDTLHPERELVLRRAQWKYPADYWINQRLGTDLIFGRPGLELEGIGYLRAAVVLRPESAHAVMNLGNGYSALGQHDQAIACYRKGIELQPNYDSCYCNLGLAYCRKGLYEEAIVNMEQAIKLRPHLTSAYSHLSMILSSCPDARLRNPRRAVELANEAIQLDPHFSNPWIALGVARYREGKWQEARTALDQSQKLGTDFPRWERWEEAIDWLFLAMSDWQLSNKHEALKHWVQAVQRIDNAGPGLKQDKHLFYMELDNLRAEAEGLLGEFRDPETAYREILRVEPKSTWAHYGLADFFRRSRQWAKAAAAYVRAFEIEESDDEGIWYRCGCLLVHSEDAEGYRKFCDRLVKRFGQSPDVHQIALLAHVCVLAPNALADSDRALQLAEQRRSLTADVEVHRLWSLHVLGLAYYRASHFEKAVATLEAAQNDPGFQTFDFKVSNWLVLAMCRHRLGQDGESAAALKSARAILASEQRELDQEAIPIQILFREAETLFASSEPH